MLSILLAGLFSTHLSKVQAQSPLLTPKEIYNRCRDSVVSIEAEGANGSFIGTGFFYEDTRTVATALHVIDHAKRIVIKARNGDSWVPVGFVLDVSADTALLKLGADSGRKPIMHAPSQTVSVGDPVYVIGDPMGLTSTLSTGVVGALRNDKGVPLVQITAPISQGSSGGPVLDGFGRVVGIVSFTFTEGQNLNMAVGTKVAKGLMASPNVYNASELQTLFAKADEFAKSGAKELEATPKTEQPDEAGSAKYRSPRA